MNDIAVHAEKIDKLFHIGAKQASYRTFRDTVTDSFTAPFRRLGKILRGQASGAAELDEEIWALKDVSFEVKTGEVVGFIGRNGAGKSTLLKVLSRITEPTNGYVDIRGRVGSLLEVGTGFHPELTGRENIYLNGAILGMKRTEINKKFDEIVAFSEVDKFIDTPVKHYSSGMYLRLAFAVAAHLEPEILIVDEVLTVGDARFQRKCLNKMEDIGRGGRTVLFVSHNMSAVTQLCQRVILLDQGMIIRNGPSREVVSSYLLSDSNTTAERVWSDPSEAPGNDTVRLLAVHVHDENGHTTDAVNITRPLEIEMKYEVFQSGHVLLPYFNIFNENGLLLFSTISQDHVWKQRPRPRGRYVNTASIPGNFLSEGMLYIAAAMVASEHDFEHQFYEHNAVAFRVVDYNDDNSARGGWTRNLGGVVRPQLKWSTQFFPIQNEARVKDIDDRQF
jgi:homopolymeric O-antigen transport system ATP-binding protein